MKIILGSQSMGRKAVLTKMGFKFEVMPADIDEKAIRFNDPAELTLAITKAKAAALLPKIHEPALLITSDQVVVCNSKIREKPVDAGEAQMFLKSYRQYPAETVTSVAITDTSDGKQECGTDIGKIWFNPLPDEVVKAYIASGDPFTHAGGFDQDHPLIAPYVMRIEGEAESITGLPMKLTFELLQRFGTIIIARP